MRLAELAGSFAITPSGANPEILGVTEDSRSISPGMLFVAVPGTALDGHDYIADALARGAVAIVAERPDAVPSAVPCIRVPSARSALADLAARFHDSPATHLSLVGFTGTFGKTSTSEVLRSLLEAGGIPTGVVGSLGTRFRHLHVGAHGLTTPGPVQLHGTLRRLVEAGASIAVIEVTSHALRLGRVEGLRFRGGLLAAIMPGEHTDFHRSFGDYVEAKRLFIDYLTPDAALAYDADNVPARQLASQAPVARAIGFSLNGRDADLQLTDVVLDGRGATFTLSGFVGATQRLRSALLGRGHLRNVALALTYALAAGVTVSTARDVLATLTPLRRRMERYDVDGRMILDDTAAHPDSLQATLAVANELEHRSLIVVYALRGNRGAEINRLNVVSLADLARRNRIDRLIVTAAADVAGPNDRASPVEIDASRQALAERACRFAWHERLDAAIADVLDSTRPGDLIVLVGAQAMDEGRRLLHSRR